MALRKRVIIFVALGLVALCLLSGGCSNSAAEEELADWRELFQEVPPDEGDALPAADDELLAQLGLTPAETTPAEETDADAANEIMVVKLYYPDEMGFLSSEERRVEAVEGVARRTMEMLLEGPEDVTLQNIFPSGAKLKDINVKTDGECIVDLSSEITMVNSRQQEELMVESIVNTLGEYPAIERVSFRVEGWDTNTLGGYTDLTGGVPVR